jgi:CheY-like chemotaxis protein
MRRMENPWRSSEGWETRNQHDLTERDGRTARYFDCARFDGTAKRPNAPDLLSSEAATVPARMLVLVVDDDPSMLKGIARMLRVHGFDAELFNSVQEFERCADLGHAACLVVDIDLKGESGIELRRRVSNSGISIPTIFITGNDNAKIRKAAYDADCSAFLVKPFPVKSLLDAIAKIGSEGRQPK